MTSALRSAGLTALSLATLAGGLTVAVERRHGGEVFSTAHAVIGRPVTPVSYAGVARRTTTRHVAYGATAGAAAAGVAVGATAAAAYRPPPTTVVVAAPPAQTCIKVVDAYGGVSYQCP